MGKCNIDYQRLSPQGHITFVPTDAFSNNASNDGLSVAYESQMPDDHSKVIVPEST